MGPTRGRTPSLDCPILLPQHAALWVRAFTIAFDESEKPAMVAHTQTLPSGLYHSGRQASSNPSATPRPTSQRFAWLRYSSPDDRTHDVSAAAQSSRGEEADPSVWQDSSSSASSLQFPGRREAEVVPQEEPPLVRVRLSVHYRVHDRQMLCIGGSQIPFGWSFLSIAKVPMTWTEGDLWTTEVCSGVATALSQLLH